MTILRAWLALILFFGGIALFVAYPYLSDYLREVNCPDDSFVIGSIGSEAGAAGGLLVFPAAFVLALCLVPPTKKNVAGGNGASRIHAIFSIGNHPIVFGVLASSALAISAVFFAMWTFSFYCATPSRILLHTQVTGPSREFTWSDVRIVRARCWVGYLAPWQGGLNLWLEDGEEILLPFGTGWGLHGQERVRRNYEAIKTALQGKSYRYDNSAIGNCPQSIYPLLASWPDRYR